MLSGIQTFGESLSEWMEKKGLTPSALAAYTSETRSATIARLMHDQLDYQRCARYITELSECYPDIDEDTLKCLRSSVDVNRYGKKMYLAKENFRRMITGDNSADETKRTNADDFADRLIAWSEGGDIKLLSVGLTDREPVKLLNLMCEKKKEICIFHFFDQEYAGALSALLAEMLSLAFNRNYKLYEIQGDRGVMMNNVLIARRGDGKHLLIVYDGGKFSTLDVSKDTELFDFAQNILLTGNRLPKRINCHFSYNSPEAIADFLAHCQMLEENKAIYQIKNEIGLEYVPVKILLENFTRWASETDARFLPYIDGFKDIFDKRYNNFLTKEEPTYLIMTKKGMTDFARTGLMKDHPFCLRAFTAEERRMIFRSLLDVSKRSASLIPLILSADDISLDYSFMGYSRECMLICKAHADYDLNNYTEIVLDSGELSGQFADYVTGILAKNHAMSKKASAEFIASLIDVVPDGE